MYSIRTLQHQPIRLVLTVGGIALCVLLMLFLISVYEGVADGSVEYIRKNKADLWVLQQNTTNILRGFSLLSTGHGKIIQEIDGIEYTAPVLFYLCPVIKNGNSSTIYLTGYDVNYELGGPPLIVEGRSVNSDNEIVLDNSFAKKFNYKIGDVVNIKNQELKVVGFSEGSNMFVVQYAFVTLKCAQQLMGYPNIVTCFLIKVGKNVDVTEMSAKIKEEFPDLEVYNHETFLANNINEMETGFLPLLYIIAIIGAIVLTVILSMLLVINILERRKDFAIMKTIGSPKGYLPKLIMEQSLIISYLGGFVAFILFTPLVLLIESIAPEISTKSTIVHYFIVILIIGLISMLSSYFAIRKVKSIYPLEAFS